MKQIIVFAALLMTSCATLQTHEQPQTTATAYESEPFANMAVYGDITVSAGGNTQGFVNDGDFETWWNANDFAPQWLEISFRGLQSVGTIELVVAQVSPGPATHKVRLERDGHIVAWHRFDTDHATDGHVFSLRIDPPRYIDKLRILTTRHEGWVAFREVRIGPRGFQSEFLSGLRLPVQLTHAGDGSGRLFVIEKEGHIRIVRDGMLIETPFLDISQQVLADSEEKGLFNVAFPPSYVDHQQFYVSYTDTNGDTVISRFATSVDPDRADPDSEEIVLTLKQFGNHHNGGTLKFGPRDGYLYIASGDGGLGEFQDVLRRVQDPGMLLGKILRIDVESGAKPYTIPADNPFVSTPGYAPETWALGLRNPWGMAFDRQTGDLYIPDTGALAYEEVNFQPADSVGGENYGWPLFEAKAPTEAEGSVDDPVFPVAIYGRDAGCAIVGGAVHEGAFVYSDFCTGKIWTLQRQGEEEWENRQLTLIGVPISSIGTDEAGNLYATGYVDGNIYMLIVAGGDD